MSTDEFETGAASAPLDTTTQRFRSDVLEPSLRRPVLVDFWAPWCGPCQQLAPALERVVKAAGGRISLVKLNIEDHPEIAEQLGIKSIPAVIAFQRGRPMDGFVGALPDAQIRGFVERLVGPIEEPEDPVASAEALIEAGDLAGAEEILAEAALGETPDVKALGLLARLYVETGRFDAARALIEAAPPSAANDAGLTAAAAALANAAQAAELGEIEELRQRAGFEPNDMQVRFDLALALNAKGLREEAADALLDIIRRDRSWSEDGARKQLLQFFDAWGPMDKAAIAARRKLSALLFS